MITYGIQVVLLTILLLAPSAVFGDVIFFRGIDRGVNAKVFELKGDCVCAAISKDDILSMNYSMGDEEGYPDFISIADNKREIRCKIEEFTDQTLLLRIPREEIASVKVAFHKDSQERKGASGGTEDVPEPSAPQVAQSLDWLKEQIIRELKDGVKDEIKEEQKAEEELVKKQTLGRVEGKIIKGDKPLQGCKVKIVPLTREGAFFASYSPVEDTHAPETVTDSEGRYIFKDIPPGQYKLYWMPPWEKSWIRRMQMEPDVFVVAGETTHPKDVNAGIATVN
ncbi:MAG: hypothetical protein ACE5KK_00225 [Candidatus Brocadiales bacterium]